MPLTETARQEQPHDDGNDVVRETPLPWGKLTVLLTIQLIEPMGYTIILPFMFQMVDEFKIANDPKDIAFYAGILFTSYHFLRSLTVAYWGVLSDRIGRRPVMLMGLLGDLLTFALFGVSRSFKWALVVRSLNGFFTGSAVVMKPIIAEISDQTNRARMMGMFQMVWSLGTMLGGAIGGVLVDPVKNYPWLFGNSVLFREYPYLLPFLVCSLSTVFSLVVGFFYLEETLVVQPSASPISGVASEATLLISESQSEEGRIQTNVKPEPFSKWDTLTPSVIRVLATGTILCIAAGMHNQLYPIFAATSLADGGLGMDPQTIGYTLTICSIVIVYMQLAVYPKDERKNGALACYRRGFIWLAVFGVSFPLLSILARHMSNSAGTLDSFYIMKTISLERCLFWGFLFIELFVRMYGDILAYTSVNSLIVNVAPKRTYLGFISGLHYQMSSITSIVGPFISGYLWSWSIKHSFPYPFNSHFAWILSGVSFVIAWYMSLSIPDSVNVFASDSDEQSSESVDSESSSASHE